MTVSPVLKRAAWFALVIVSVGCKKPDEVPARSAPSPTPPAERAAALPHTSDPKNIVSIAAASKDHTTLVAALKAADYVTSVGNPGPLTVFAPTDDAFKKLPPGTVDNLVKPENKDKLQDILKYHVTTSVYEAPRLTDGLELGMANGGKAKIQVKDGAVWINDAKVVASVRATNGIVHVIDAVLLPPAK
jgi:uncharacterized surface protein with fasciclin (FAS1) repeats